MEKFYILLENLVLILGIGAIVVLALIGITKIIKKVKEKME